MNPKVLTSNVQPLSQRRTRSESVFGAMVPHSGTFEESLESTQTMKTRETSSSGEEGRSCRDDATRVVRQRRTVARVLVLHTERPSTLRLMVCSRRSFAAAATRLSLAPSRHCAGGKSQQAYRQARRTALCMAQYDICRRESACNQYLPLRVIRFKCAYSLRPRMPGYPAGDFDGAASP